ncbi:MAG: hypothetical protein ABIO70_23095 [Pseudomonadota bacterium]
MAKHQPFVIPAGVNLTLTDRGMSVEHLGDIILDKSLGDRMGRVASAEGSVTLRGNFVLDRVEAPRGGVTIEGTVSVRSIRAETVGLTGPRITATSVQASRQIVVGACRIDADVLVAPRIDIDAKAVGRIPIIECRNEPGPNAIKGGFSIAEYDELLGNVAAYLAEREVEPLDGSGEEEEGEEKDDDEERSDVVIEACGADDGEHGILELVEADDAVEADDGEVDLLVEEGTDDPDTYTDSAALKVGVATAVPQEVIEVQAGAVECDEEPSLIEVQAEALSPIESEDLQLPPGARVQVDATEVEEVIVDQVAQVDENFEDIKAEPEIDTTHQQLLEILEELRQCYADDEQPPILAELAELVAGRQYEEVVVRLPQIWNDLVRYHRERGLRIRRQVTTTFNNIMTVVKNAPSVTLNQQ